MPLNDSESSYRVFFGRGRSAENPGEQAHHAEETPHCQFHVTGRTNFEHEMCPMIRRVADDMQPATRHVQAVSWSQPVISSAHASDDRAGDHLDSFVLTKMHMPGH